MLTQKYGKFILGLLAVVIYSAQSIAVVEATTTRHSKMGIYWLKKPSYSQTAMKNPVVENKQTNSVDVTKSEVLAEQILQTGHGYLGAPYVYGTSNGTTFDCSGFIRFIFGKHGIKLPSGSYNQVNLGTTVSRSQLKKGDLIFFRVGNQSRVGHVGVYAGNNRVLHTYQTGVKYDSLDAPWLKHGYVTAKRVI